MAINRAEVAAYYHARMAVDDRFGYTQGGGRWGTGPLEIWECNGVRGQFLIGDRDCSSSVIDCWSEALRGSAYEGALNGATYTGDMLPVFTGSGLFEWHPMGDGYIAKKGDVYLSIVHHTAMCQNDWPDTLSEASINEWGGITGGQIGDQTGWEFSTDKPYYDFPWDGILAYNHKADEDPAPAPSQDSSEPINNGGIKYRAHCADLGWLPMVRDGQIAGTTGQWRRMEAVEITPPEGWVIKAKAHLAGNGWVDYPLISSANPVIVGTTGEWRRIEAIYLEVVERPEGDNRKLYFQVHQEEVGWKGVTEEGFATGTDGMSKRLEAIKIWIA